MKQSYIGMLINTNKKITYIDTSLVSIQTLYRRNNTLLRAKQPILMQEMVAARNNSEAGDGIHEDEALSNIWIYVKGMPYNMIINLHS